MSPSTSKGSVRTCVGCRERATHDQLLRVVAGDLGSGLEVLPDPARRARGRGAHLHPTAECLALAIRRRALPRALRVQGQLGTTGIEELLRSGGAAPQQHRP